MGLIAALQMTSNNQVLANLEKVEHFLSQASKLGVKLIVLPENFAFMDKLDAEKFKIAEQPGIGPIQDKMQSLAKKYGLWIVGGTIPIQSPAEDKVYATTFVWDEKGQVIARYDKIHLFDVKVNPGIEEYVESRTVFPGQKVVSFDSPLGKIGLSICYDLRFPELYRALTKQGAEILLVPSAFTVITGRAHWKALLLARAIENCCYVVAAAEVGTHPNGRTTYGHSMIIDPWGRILADEKDGEGLIVAEIDLAELKKIREKLPVLQHRKITNEGSVL